jgi:hypothetical protein
MSHHPECTALPPAPVSNANESFSRGTVSTLHPSLLPLYPDKGHRHILCLFPSTNYIPALQPGKYTKPFLFFHLRFFLAERGRKGERERNGEKKRESERKRASNGKRKNKLVPALEGLIELI